MAAKKSKKFRIATEGATADGRTIPREWLQQMADNYDPAKYRATINIEHLRSYSPDSQFRNYGFVDALEVAENGEKKMELFATITPTDDLVTMTGAMQKVFTSMEVNPKFAGTDEAYLVGLAVTDNPASLGTEMLEFSAGKGLLNSRKLDPGNHFSAASETVIEFVEAKTEGPGILERVRALFSNKGAADAERFGAVEQAIEEIAEHGKAQSTKTAGQFQKVDGDIKQTNTRLDDFGKRIDELVEKLNLTPEQSKSRPQAVGPGTVLTDC